MKRTFVFEIKFVEHENPFYQLGKLFVFKCQCELYEYNQDDFDTGIAGIDDVEASNAYSIKYNMNSGNSIAFTAGEQVKLYGTNTVVGEVQSWDGTTGVLYLMNLTGQTVTAGSTQFVGVDSGATWTVSTVGDELEMIEDELAQNQDFETTGDSYLDFSETNPFGEV